MAITYSENSDLVFDTGKSLNDFFDSSLTAEEIITYKDKARLRAYNYINSRYLEGRTVVPATGITELLQVEVDLVIAGLMEDAFSLQTSNTSEWSDKYRSRATDVLNNLKFTSSAEVAISDPLNTGNGTISAITVNDMFTRTEQWVLRATSATKFSVYGSLSGYLHEAEVGNQYPEKDWGGIINDYGLTINTKVRYEQYPISFLITAGDVDFVVDDKFVFKTYASSDYVNRNGRIIRG